MEYLDEAAHNIKQPISSKSTLFAILFLKSYYYTAYMEHCLKILHLLKIFMHLYGLVCLNI